VPRTRNNTIIKLVLHNSSASTFYNSDFQIGIISPLSNNAILDAYGERIKYIDLPDKTKLFLLSNVDNLFPLAYTDFYCNLYFSMPRKEESIIVRLFSSAGIRDYPFKIIFDLDDLPE
jgi:hypothetical protein